MKKKFMVKESKTIDISRYQMGLRSEKQKEKEKKKNSQAIVVSNKQLIQKTTKKQREKNQTPHHRQNKSKKTPAVCRGSVREEKKSRCVVIMPTLETGQRRLPLSSFKVA